MFSIVGYHLQEHQSEDNRLLSMVKSLGRSFGCGEAGRRERVLVKMSHRTLQIFWNTPNTTLI